MCVNFFNFDHLNIKLQISELFESTKFRALLFFSLHSSPSSSKLLSMTSCGGELLLDSSSPWSGVSSLSSFSIPLPFIFQEAKESIDEEDPRPTSSNGAYITNEKINSQLNLFSSNITWDRFEVQCLNDSLRFSKIKTLFQGPMP